MTRVFTHFVSTHLVRFIVLGGSLFAAVLPVSAQQASSASPKPGTATITVSVSGVHDRDGVLRVNLYQSPDGFPADTNKACQKRNVVLKDLAPYVPLEPLQVTFTDVPPGTYAVCSIHDGNSNNKLDANFLGAPTEDWAVSNDARPKFRSPRFDEAKFTLVAGQTKELAFRVRH